MATLEKIRSKSVLLFVIIIVALLAFILGDFLTSGKFYSGSGTTMYSAGSRKVDYTDYQNVANRQQGSGQDADAMQQTMLQALLMQSLLEEQYQQLGIKVTDNEISQVMKGNHPLNQQFLYYIAQNFQLPTADGEAVFDFVQNPTRYGLPAEYGEQLMAAWIQQEQQVEAALKSQAFSNLIGGLFVANELDAKSRYNDNNTRLALQYVSTPLIADQSAEVTDKELVSKWDQEKYMYSTLPLSEGHVIEPIRAIDYIVVNIVPSPEDIAVAEAEVDQVVAALQEQPELEGVAGRAKFAYNVVTLPKADVKKNADLRTLPDSMMKAGAVNKFRLNHMTHTFTVAKVLDASQKVDSVNLTVLAVPTAIADSIQGLVAEGTALADLAAVGQLMANDTWQVLEGVNFPMGSILANGDFRNSLLSAGTGKVEAYTDSIMGATYLYQVNERRAPKDFLRVAVVKYTVDPSPTTVSNINQQLNSFLASNSKGNAFSQHADSLYRLQHGFVSASTSHIGNLDDTRKAVKWVMDKASVGDVSPIYEARVKSNPNLADAGIQNAYLVVAVKEAFNDGVVPYNSPQVRDQLAAKVRADKKAQEIIAQYAGKATDVAGYAQLMDGSVQTDSAVVFTSQRMGSFMPGEYALQGMVAAAAPGQLVGPVQGANEVVVFMVNPIEGTARPYAFAQDGMDFMNTFGMNFDRTGRMPIDPVMFSLLVGDRQVKNKSLNFVSGEE